MSGWARSELGNMTSLLGLDRKVLCEVKVKVVPNNSIRVQNLLGPNNFGITNDNWLKKSCLTQTFLRLTNFGLRKF